MKKKLEKVYKICLESGKPYAGKLARTVWWKSKRCQLNSLLLTNERFNNGLAIRSNYTAHVDFAFNSLEHIMRDVNNGWLIRYTHANVASFFFIFVYAHIGRGLYYSSYKSPRVLVWTIGVIILA